MANGDAVLGQFTQGMEEKKVDATKKLRVGIIGTGWIAEAHMEQYKKFPDVEMVAMADLIPGKAQAFCEKMAWIIPTSISTPIISPCWTMSSWTP